MLLINIQLTLTLSIDSRADNQRLYSNCLMFDQKQSSNHFLRSRFDRLSFKSRKMHASLSKNRTHTKSYMETTIKMLNNEEAHNYFTYLVSFNTLFTIELLLKWKLSILLTVISKRELWCLNVKSTVCPLFNRTCS